MAKQNLASLNAQEELYGHKLTVTKILRTILLYEIMVFIYAFVLYSIKNWMIILIWLVLAAIYIYTSIIPKQIKFNYETRSEAERNRFINIVTQGMTNENADVIKVLNHAIQSLNGEFKLDMQTLMATIMASNTYREQHLAFKKLLTKYHDDYYFCRFMEEVETNVHESKYQLATYQAFKDHHNLIMSKEKEFEAQKKIIQMQMVIMLVALIIVVAISLYSQGYEKFLQIYGTNIVGEICSTIFMITVFIFVKSFFKHKFDTSVTSI